MNTWQIVRQIRYKLEQLTWDQAPNEKVFAQVVVSDVPARQHIGRLRHPFAVVHSPNFSSAAENPHKMGLSLDVEIYTQVENDQFGEGAVIGASHSVTTGSSKGKGILQIQQEVVDLMHQIERKDGVRYISLLQSGRSESQLQGDVSKLIKVLTFQIRIYEEETYPDAFNLAASVVAGDVILTWQDHPDRFDRIVTGGIVVRRKSGSNPTGPTDGVAVGTANVGAETITDLSPPSGTWYYGIFAGYDKGYLATPTTATDYSAGQFVSATVP